MVFMLLVQIRLNNNNKKKKGRKKERINILFQLIHFVLVVDEFVQIDLLTKRFSSLVLLQALVVLVFVENSQLRYYYYSS